ncbi:MAG TPA: hypothetical protein VMZ92_17605 [Planctomycetota bacterium]|nr:hypothetical protein [Planctomycetota bacterium]
MKKLPILMVAAALAVLLFVRFACEPGTADRSVEVRLVGLEVTGGANSSSISVEGSCTSLKFIAQRKGWHVIGIDKTSSRLVSFTDDNGTDLAAPYRRNVIRELATDIAVDPTNPRGMLRTLRRKDPTWWVMNEERTVRRGVPAYAFALASSRLPAKGARELTVDARVTFILSKGESTARRTDVDLTPGTILQFGTLQLHVVAVPSDVEKPEGRCFGLQWAHPGLNLDKRIVAIRFLAPDGAEIPSSTFYSIFGWDEGNRETSTNLYVLPEEPEKVTVEVTWFEEDARVTVPVKVRSGLGF